MEIITGSFLRVLRLLCLSLIFSGPLAAGQVIQYYVNCSSATPGNGSSTAPWNSLGQANVFTFQPGDILSLTSNVTCNGTLAPLGSGNKTAPIQITTYPIDSTAGPAIINGGGSNFSLTLTNQDYWRITNLSITNPASKLGPRQGIYVAASDSKIHYGITIDHNVVYDVAGQTNKATYASDFAKSAGIAISASNGSRFDNVSVRDNEVHDCGGGAIKIRPGQTYSLSQNVRVSYNKISSCGGDGIIIATSDSPSIDHNVAAYLGMGKYPWTGGNFAGMWVETSQDPVISHNVVHGTIMSAYDSEAFDCDLGVTGTCTVEYNYSHDNAGGAFLNCDGCGTTAGTVSKQVVRYNIFERDCRIISVGTLPELWFYNNIIYCPDRPFDINVPPTTYFVNNIFVGMQSNASLPTGSGIDWKSNMFQTVLPPTENGIVGDPKFVDPGLAGNTLGAGFGYRVGTGSAALESGALVVANGNQDFFGNAVKSNVVPNVGAYNGPGVN
ncbi:hypothetical protein N7490_005450 [Penicillium lividum]|nr:hypothetical protein N7490_005450 [Penicillium lividum]